MYTVYIIQSKKNSHYYIGFTSDLTKRIYYHNSGKNRSTKNKGPWELVHSEVFEDKESAWLRERQIKSYKGGEAFRRILKLIK
jgi:putative endonuclease